MIGTTLGRYEILSELGSGGMATVYRARDQELGREVAIKMMHPHLAKRAEYAERFRREARAVAALRHRHIIEIHDFVHHDDGDQSHTFMVSELVEGPALSTFLTDHGRLLPEVAALIASRVAEALVQAHKAGIVHRDVKPENIMIAPSGRVVLTDFGIARVLEGETVTATGALIGSPNYMSPEQARGHRPRPGSDLFSLGVVLYRMTTGRLPFPGKDPLTVISAILKGRYIPPVQAYPAVGNTLDRIIVRCLKADPEERTSDADALADALTDFAAEGGLTDVDDELERFFDAPKSYETRTTRRIVGCLLERAERKITERSLAVALALCDRVLSLDADNADAQRLLSEVGRRQSSLKLLLAGGIAALVVLAVVLGWMFWPKGPSKPAGATVSQSTAVDADAGDELAAEDAAAATDALDSDALVPATAPPDASPNVAPAMSNGNGSGSHAGRRRRRPNVRVPPMAHRADAGSAAAMRTADAAVPARVRPAGPGRLLVTVLPYCDIKVDGRPFGRSPMPKARPVPAGWHNVTCRHPVTRRTYTKRVQINPVLTTLRGTLLKDTRVTVRLTRGTRIVIGTASYRPGPASLSPGSHRYSLLQGTTVLQTGWLRIPPGRCTLVDTPRPACR